MGISGPDGRPGPAPRGLGRPLAACLRRRPRRAGLGRVPAGLRRHRGVLRRGPAGPGRLDTRHLPLGAVCASRPDPRPAVAAADPPLRRAAPAEGPVPAHLHLRSSRRGHPAGRAAGRDRDLRGRISGPLRTPRRGCPVQGRPAGLGQKPAGALSMDGRGLEIPEPASLLDEETVAFAADLIDRSAVAGQAEAALARPTGRRRSLPVRAVLAALLLLAIDDRPLHLTRVTELLFRRLSPASRALLGITGTAPDQRNFLAAYRRVRYCFHLICSTADPSRLA